MGIKRDFALSLVDAGMMNDEYVYLFVDPRTRGFGRSPLQFRIYFLSLVTQEDGVIMDVWIDRYGRKDGRDDEAKAAFQRIFILTDVGLFMGNQVNIFPSAYSGWCKLHFIR